MGREYVAFWYGWTWRILVRSSIFLACPFWSNPLELSNCFSCYSYFLFWPCKEHHFFHLGWWGRNPQRGRLRCVEAGVLQQSSVLGQPQGLPQLPHWFHRVGQKPHPRPKESEVGAAWLQPFLLPKSSGNKPFYYFWVPLSPKISKSPKVSYHHEPPWAIRNHHNFTSLTDVHQFEDFVASCRFLTPMVHHQPRSWGLPWIHWVPQASRGTTSWRRWAPRPR